MKRRLCVGVCIGLMFGACSNDPGTKVGTPDSGPDGADAGADVTTEPDVSEPSCKGAECEGLVIVDAPTTVTTESGDQALLEVRLDRAPSADVQLAVSVTDDTEGSVAPATITFTPENWNGVQTVTVTGVDDDTADGEQAYQVQFGALESTDEVFHGFVPAPVDLTNTDDDSPGITVGAPTASSGENGDQASFTVVLNSQPTADVTLTLASTNPVEGIAAPTSLTFTSDNWAAPQTVLVTGQDDDVIDGDQTYSVAFESPQSDDAGYAALVVEPVELVNIDDDTPGIRVSTVSGSSGEDGTQAILTVVLNSMPAADVTVPFSSSDTTEGVLAQNSFVFTPQNWAAPQTILVTGQDDALADGNQMYNVVFEALQSDDVAYAAVVPPAVAVINVDDDTAGIAVAAVVAQSTEDGDPANISVHLTSEPFEDVTLTFDTDDASEGVPAATQLTFTPVNWAAPQTLLVAGQNDDVADGNQPYAIVFGPTVSNDTAYAVITPPNVSLTNVDNDTAGIDVSAISRDTTEAGGSASFDIVLTSEPFGDVTVAFDTDDASEGTLSATSLTFTATDWNTPQTVTVTGQNDDVDDGNQTFSVVFSSVTSTDAAYAALALANLEVTNVDDDTAGITVTPTSGKTTERGGQAFFDVVLNSEPTDPVSIVFSSNDTSEGTVSPSAFTFNPTDWSTPRTIVVTGVDDGLRDGDQPYLLEFVAAVSFDANYAGLKPASRKLVNDDDEPPAVGTTGTTGVISGSPWIVCRADSSTAWVAANDRGFYNAVVACQSLGYSTVDAQGGTCGTVCGYCNDAGREHYDGGGGSVTNLGYTVHWRCAQ